MKTKKVIILILTTIFSFSCTKDEESATKLFTLEVKGYDSQRAYKIKSNAFSERFLTVGGLSLIDGNVPPDGKVDVEFLYPEELSLPPITNSFNANEDGKYSWNVAKNTIETLSSGGKGLIGKWVDLSGCVNKVKELTNFKFNSNGTGHIYNADCNSTCMDYGVYLYFKWEDKGDSVVLNYTGNNSYCGQTVAIPKPDTLNYSINGNELSIAGIVYTKK